MKESIRLRKYIVTLHAVEEMDDDCFSIFDIEHCILHGQIIERQKEQKTAEWKYVLTPGSYVPPDDKAESGATGLYMVTVEMSPATLYTEDLPLELRPAYIETDSKEKPPAVMAGSFRNQYGWGEITHRKVLIDTEKPEPFEVSVDNEGNPTNPTPLFSFQTDDSLSGIDHYTVEIDGYQVSVSPQEAKEGFRPAPQGPGSLTALVKAFDKAGNFSQASVNFTIEPIGGIEITKIPSRIQVGEILEVEGKTLVNIIARVYVQKEGEEEIIMEKVYTDAEGRFILRYGGALATGKYFVWAQGEDARGALTTPTQKYTVEIGLPPFLKFGKIALDYLSIMITLIVLIIGAIAIIFYSWYQISVWRKRARAETQEVSQSVRAAFRALREEVEEQISQLDQKPGLTKKEKAIRDKLQEALDMSEKFIGKEIEDVEKELE